MADFAARMSEELGEPVSRHTVYAWVAQGRMPQRHDQLRAAEAVMGVRFDVVVRRVK